MLRLFKITDQDIIALREVIEGCYFFEPQDKIKDYYDKVDYFKQLFAKDIFEEDCI